MVLGMHALKIVALGFTLANELPRRGSAAGLDLPAYWHRSLLNGVISRSLARTLERQVAEEAFLCGLLSEIGKLVLAHALTDEYAPVVEEGGGWPNDGLERERLGFRASEAGEVLLRSWSVPELLVLGSAFANRRDGLPADAPYLARRLADIVALARLGTSDIFGDVWDTSMPPFATEAAVAVRAHHRRRPSRSSPTSTRSASTRPTCSRSSSPRASPTRRSSSRRATRSSR